MSKNRQVTDHEKRITRLEQAVISPDLETDINIKSIIPAGTVIDLNYDPPGAGTPLYEVDGPAQYLGEDEDEFNANAKLSFLINGVHAEKGPGEDIEWVSSSTFKVNIELYPEETIGIIFAPHRGGSSGDTIKGLAIELRNSLERIRRLGIANWETNTLYYVGDKVVHYDGSNRYIYECLEQHTSGDFAVDLSATKWDFIEVEYPFNVLVNGTLVTGDMEFVDGTGITLVPDGPGKKITFLSNNIRSKEVDESAIQDGHSLIYDSDDDKIVYTLPRVGSKEVDETDIGNLKILQLDGGNLVYKTLIESGAGIIGTKEVDETSIADQGVPTYDSSSDEYKIVRPKLVANVFLPDDQVVSSDVFRYIVPHDMEITSIKANVRVAPTGAAIIVDIKKNGTTIFASPSNRLKIEDGNLDALPPGVGVPSFSKGDILSADITQIGSTYSGEDMSILIEADKV